MIFTADRVELASAISRAAQGIPPRPAQPVYAGMHLETDLDANLLHLTSSDGDMRLTSYCPVKPEDGHASCVLPGKMLSEMSSYFPGKEIRFEATGAQAVFSSGRSRFVLSVMDGDIFPQWKDQDTPAFMGLDGDQLARALRAVIPASTQDGAVALSAVSLEVSDGTLTLVASDTVRLAVAEIPFDDIIATWDTATIRQLREPEAALLPARIADKFARDLTGTAGVGWDDGLITIEYHDGRLLSRKTGGVFLPWRNIMKKEPQDRATADAKDLARAIKMAQLACGPDNKVMLILDEGWITITAGEEGRECTEGTPCDYTGERREYAFGARDLLDGLTPCPDDVQIAMGPPLFLRSPGFTYVLQHRRNI
jgi:DNA polymerase III subunit beta